MEIKLSELTKKSGPSVKGIHIDLDRKLHDRFHKKIRIEGYSQRILFEDFMRWFLVRKKKK